MVRICINEYWIDFCKTIQQASDTGNIKGMYDGIKKTIGPNMNKTVTVKSKSCKIITDKSKQLERWVKCDSEQYFGENIVPRCYRISVYL